LNAPQTWPVTFHDDFDAEFDALSKLGPAAGRPHVGTLKNPKHPNMKELRFKANNGAEVWRAVFAFDTRREAIILVAAAKQGVDEDKFYRDLLFKANTRYEQHLKNLTTAKARQGKGRR
jgi:hypothetical protein